MAAPPSRLLSSTGTSLWQEASWVHNPPGQPTALSPLRARPGVCTAAGPRRVSGGKAQWEPWSVLEEWQLHESFLKTAWRPQKGPSEVPFSTLNTIHVPTYTQLSLGNILLQPHKARRAPASKAVSPWPTDPAPLCSAPSSPQVGMQWLPAPSGYGRPLLLYTYHFRLNCPEAGPGW